MGRVKEELLPYSEMHLELIEKAFGKDERERAESMNVIVREGERDRVDFEPANDTFSGVRLQVYHAPLNFLGPIIPFHEYCHVMHILQWPRASYLAPENTCEACAILGELWLARKLPTDHPIRRCVEYRAVWVHPPEAVAQARRAMLSCKPGESYINAAARVLGMPRVRGYTDA